MKCPECKGIHIKRGKGNMWCDDCGFSPIEYSPNVGKSGLVPGYAGLRALLGKLRMEELCRSIETTDYERGRDDGILRCIKIFQI